MFDVGFWELVLIFGVGLMILGPERMPRVASQLGRWVGRARRTASTLRRQLEQEIAIADSPPPPRRKPKPLTPVNSPASAAKDAEPGDGENEQPADDGDKQKTSPGDAEPPAENADKVAGHSADDS